MIDIHTLTIKQARKSLDTKEYSAVDLANAYIAEIEKNNPTINAYLEVYTDVIEQAKNADVRIARGESNPLLGIPLAVKDNILISGKTATGASKILEGFVAPYDATAIKKLKEQGVVFLGRTNMDEFAMGGSTENSAFGVTKNPLDIERVSGGSSGGSAAAVAMNGALGALGSDTGGSVREPSAFCEVVGFKPTYGGVSRHGLMAMGSSLDVIGPIAKTVTDTEMLYNAIKGHDPLDSTTYTETTYPASHAKEKMVIGVPYHIINQDGIDPSVRRNFDESIETLKTKGFEIKDITLPNIQYGLAVYYILMPAEVSSNMARFDGVKYGMHVDGANLLEDYVKTRGQGFGAEVRRRILIGTYVLSTGYYDAYYGKALAVRTKLSGDFKRAFADVDVIATPTTPEPAFKIGEKANDPLSMYLADIFTVTANIVGIPAISVPSGMVSVGATQMPVGIQFMAPHGHDQTLFDIGKKFLNE